MSRRRRRSDSGMPSSQRYGRDEWLQDRLRRLKIALGQIGFECERADPDRANATLEKIRQIAQDTLEQEAQDQRSAGY